jgi:hypothetical protein
VYGYQMLLLLSCAPLSFRHGKNEKKRREIFGSTYLHTLRQVPKVPNGKSGGGSGLSEALTVK